MEETFLSLAYGMEIMILFEINLNSARKIIYDEKQNEENIATNLDLVRKIKKTLRSNLPYSKRRWIDRYFDSKVRKKNFVV